MKVPPKRKGNPGDLKPDYVDETLNESPSEKEGKCKTALRELSLIVALNESPSEKEGKFRFRLQG